MTLAPTNPTIYHITHQDNLPSILRDGGMLSDADIFRRGGPDATIGMSSIKERRLRLPVRCHAHIMVGENVPFYFCPRSIMLYLIHKGNHEELTYRGGQGPILHLEANLKEVIGWATSQDVPWAFSLSNAGAYYTEFRNSEDSLGEINWEAVQSLDFRDPMIKEGKQAEFLVYNFFPWNLIRRIGVLSTTVQSYVLRALSGVSHKPVVEVMRSWYY